MPKKNDESEKTEIQKVRIPTRVREAANKARMDGARASDAESTFLGYLITIGLAKYEKTILPAETSTDEVISRTAYRQGPAAGHLIDEEHIQRLLNLPNLTDEAKASIQRVFEQDYKPQSDQDKGAGKMSAG